MLTLDLRHSAWIPVRVGQQTREIGLREALLSAHELREVRDPMPIVEFGLYRLLIVLIMDIYRLDTLSDLEDLLAAGKFDVDKVDAYFALWHDRFDLFHADHPFLQDAGMAHELDKPLCGLLPPVPSGTNANHFYHARERDFAVCPEAAARLLTTLAPFMTAGGAGLAPSINGAPPWYALITGKSLFQTLCLNCCGLPLQPQVALGVPAWRREDKFEVERRQSATLLDGLTWQARRVLLVPGVPGSCTLTGRATETLISTMKFGPGAAAGFPWTDPNVAYRIDMKGAMVRRPEEGRQVWRDVGPMALLHNQTHGQHEDQQQFMRPHVVDQYADLYQDLFRKELVPDHLQLVLYGMRTDLKMKIFEWQRESLEPLPAPLVLFEAYGQTAQTEIDRATRVDSGLRSALKRAYPRDGAGNKKAFDSRIDYARRRFWTLLREHYMALLAGLATVELSQLEKEKISLIQQWKKCIRRVGLQVLDEAISDLNGDANILLRTEVVVRRAFATALYMALDKEDETQPKAKAKSEGKKGRINREVEKGAKQA